MSSVVQLPGAPDLPRRHADLHSEHDTVARAAQERLDNLNAMELLTLIRMELQRCKLRCTGKISLWLLTQAGILALIILAIVFLAWILHGGCDGGCGGVENLFSGPPDVEHHSDQLRQIANALAKSSDPHAPGAMLEAVSISPFLAGLIGSTLDDRLAAIERRDAIYWAPAHRRLLVRWLEIAIREKAGRGRILAIVHAIEQVGADEKSVPFRILKQHGDPAIRAAADRCQAALQRRALANQSARELLRASSSQGSPSTELLRAGVGRRASDPNELLRPPG